MTNLEWLTELVHKRQAQLLVDKLEPPSHITKGLVMHVASGVVGIVAHVHEPGQCYSGVSGEPISSYVLELEEGHTFTFKPDVPWGQSEFIALRPEEAHFFLMLVGSLDVVVKSSASLGKAMNLKFGVAKTLLVAALERATRALKTAPTQRDPT
jgi:hypothetical protein